MTDNTEMPDLFNEILDRLMLIDEGGKYGNVEAADDIEQLCIESDEAREYWKAYYKIDPNMTILGSAHEADIRKQFVEQACEAIKKEMRDEMDSIDDEIGYSTSRKKGYEYAMGRAQQVIKEKFK